MDNSGINVANKMAGTTTRRPLSVRLPLASVCLCPGHKTRWNGPVNRMLFAGNVSDSRFKMLRIDFKGEFKDEHFPRH